jgi:hypothetical protein
VLIVKSEVLLAPKLQDALEEQGAETVLVRDPYTPTGADNLTRFEKRARRSSTPRM